MQIELILLLDSAELDDEFVFTLLVLDFDCSFRGGFVHFQVLEIDFQTDVFFLLLVQQYFVVKSQNHSNVFFLFLFIV